jgi:CBS domain-containing protein
MGLARVKAEQEVVTLLQGARALEAARLMAERHVGAVIVVSPDGKPVGIVTDRDVTTRLVAARIDAESTAVDDIMTKNPVTARDDSSDVAVLMGLKGVRRLPLVDANGRLTGVVALDDLLAVHVHRLGCLAQVLAHQRAGEDASRGR